VRLIDGLGGPPREEGALAVRDGTIAAVGPADGMPRADAVLDGGGRTLLPGLIDAHAHLIYSGARSLEDIDKTSVEAATINAVLNAGKVLRAGYTAVRDVGTIGNVAVAVREAIAAGKVPGPEVVASGSILCATGGLGDTLPPHWRSAHGLGQIVDGPDEIRRAVRRQIRAGVDNVKLAASGVEIGPYAHTWMTTFSEEETRVAVEEAHRWGRTVAVHAQSYDAVRFALRAGANTIEHGTRMDDETIALFVRSGAVLVPTLQTLFSVLELGAAHNLQPKHREEMAVNEPLWLDSLRRAKAAGVPIAAGADLGNRIPHGANAKELALLVRAGFTPMEAIVAATSVAARALKRQDRIGSLEVGKAADLLLFDGDPLAEIEQLMELDRIALVVKNGQPVAGSLLPGPA
jgi:imidazolonepropionase-like amidohydrolase